MKPETSLYQPAKRIFTRILKRHLRTVPKDGLILDLGCGFGDFAVFVSQQLKRRVLGLEVNIETSKIALEVTKGTGVLGIELYNGTSFPLSDETLDSVYACSVLEHIPDDSALLSEIWRTLKSKGVLILTVPNASKLPFTKNKYPDHVRPYLKSELRAKVEESGFFITAGYYRGYPLMAIYSTVVVGLAKKFIKKGYYSPSIYTYWRLKEQPILTKALWQLYRYILNPVLSAIIIGEFELLKNHIEGDDLILVATKDDSYDFKKRKGT